MQIKANQWWLAVAVAGMLLTIVAALRTSSGPSGPNDPKFGTVVARVNDAVITQSQVQSLLAGLASETRQNAASAVTTVLDSLIDQELLFQAGVRAGLLDTDPVIRRRIVQLQLDQLLAQLGQPSPAQLRAFYQAHIQQYTVEPQVQFRQLFFASRNHQDIQTRERALKLRAEIGDEAKFASLEAQWPEKLRAHDSELYYSQSRLATLYGRSFAAELTVGTPGQILGPLASSLGLHLVWVRDLRPASSHSFEAVQAQVEQDWRQAERARLTREYLAELRRAARIEVYWPGSEYAQQD